MAFETTQSGGNYFAIHTFSATGLVTTTPVYAMQKQVSNAWAWLPERGAGTITLDPKIRNDSFLTTVLQTYGHNVSVEQSQVDYEDDSYDTLISGISTLIDDGKVFAFVDIKAADADGNKEVGVGAGVLSGSTGDMTTGSKTATSTVFVVQVIAHPTAMDFPTLCFPTSKVGTPVQVTLAGGSAVYGKQVNMVA